MLAEYWVTVGAALILGALLGAIVSIWGVTRTIRHKSVIEERQKWRDTVRGLIPELIATEDRNARVRLRNEIVLRLNPYDEMDNEAIAAIDAFITDATYSKGSEVVGMFQKLLKLDWERAKIEASVVPLHASRSSAP